jgi:hypothetical protein
LPSDLAADTRVRAALHLYQRRDALLIKEDVVDPSNATRRWLDDDQIGSILAGGDLGSEVYPGPESWIWRSRGKSATS